MEEITLQAIWEKLIRIEVNLNNHLNTHDKIVKWFLAPILVCLVATIVVSLLGLLK